MYGGGGVGGKGDGDDEGGGGVGGQEVKTGKVEKAVLFLFSLSYSNNDISVCDNRSSSCPTYMFY